LVDYDLMLFFFRILNPDPIGNGHAGTRLHASYMSYLYARVSIVSLN